jgi:cobaltochelatase CobN
VHGAAWRDQFARRLSKTTVTVKNESSVEIDMLDSDDFFNYHGGLIAATQTASGEKPRSYSTNTADSDHVETLELNAETARIMRARINNPKWLEGLEKHGYKGAQEISAMVDIIFGWDATSENIENWMYDEITKNFVLNEETRQWINEVNPWAMHAMSERLLEASQRGMWEASDEMLQQLRDVYMEVEGGIEENL